MIKGMTGFGTAQVSRGALKAVVEIKTLNHRYFDINYFLPVGFSSLENKIQQIVEKEFHRGRVTISIKITEKSSQTISFNKAIVKQYLKNAVLLEKEFKVKNNLTLVDFIHLPGVIQSKEVLVTPESLWSVLEKGIKKSVASVVNMRKREGRSLTAYILDKLRLMSLQIKKIQKNSKIILDHKRSVSTGEEFKSFQKSIDVHEEISRLSHYVDELRLLFKSDIPVGKKIDFMAQEMQRETNTIGSKLQHKSVSDAVITLKSKIEKIREQAQNIE